MQNKLSVVQVIDMLNVGGAERVLVTLANILHEHGHKVKVITTVAPGNLFTQLHAGIEFQSLNRKWKWNPATMYKLVKALKDFDIIHVHSRHNLRYLFVAKKLFGLRKKIFYHEHHGNRINTKSSFIEKKLFQQTIFIAVSESLKEWAIREAGISVKRAFVLPNIVLKEKIDNISKDDSGFSLVVVSNFVPVKNLEFAVEILQELIKESDKFKLMIIGAIADKEYYDKILSLIKNRDLNEHIIIINNCINVQSLLPQYDLAIHTSTSESGPLVLVEYMAQSLPFITYKTGEVAEQIEKYIPDFVMDNFTVSEWVLQIKTLLYTDKVVLQGRLQQIFEKNYSPQAYYEQCIFIYNNGLNA